MTQGQITDTNCIICGDCRDQLARIPDGSVDLIYMDPPFFSGRNYEIIWKDGAERRSFEDTKFYMVVCECGEEFPAHHKFCAKCGASYEDAKERRSSNIEVYLDWLRPRLQRCKEVLSDTGSIYVHLDYHAVHYVKVMMDKIFGYNNFKNDITWCYTGPSNTKEWFPRKHDTILFYTKSTNWTFNIDDIKVPYKKLKTGKTNGIFKSSATLSSDGKVPEDWWDNMSPVGRLKNERLGYPTQKPESLLERIIKASSNPGDVILDPFCGCGTAVAVAQKFGRRWIGIDVSPTSCKLMVKRLRGVKDDWVRITETDIIDLPRTLKELRVMEPFEFQNWVINQINGKQSTKKSGDHGIDGWTVRDWSSTDGTDGRNPVQVKRSDKVGSPTIRQFAQDIRATGRVIGLIVAFSFSSGAVKEANEIAIRDGIEIQLQTVEELLNKNDPTDINKRIK